MPYFYRPRGTAPSVNERAFKGSVPTQTVSASPLRSLQAASGAGGCHSDAADVDLETRRALEALKEVIRIRLCEHVALIKGEVAATESNFPSDLQEQISARDLHMILYYLHRGLAGTLGGALLEVKNGESLYLHRKTLEIEYIDKASGELKFVSFPRSIHIFRENDEFRVAIETKNKLAEKDHKGHFKKGPTPKFGGSKNVKLSWVIDKEGYTKEASMIFSVEMARQKISEASRIELREIDKQAVDRLIKKSIQNEMEKHSWFNDPAIVMPRGPYCHHGKQGITMELRAPYYQWDLFDMAKNQTLYASMLEIPGRRERIALEITRGVKVMHSKDVIHSDIKPENILIGKSSYRPVLTDLGLSCKVEEKQTLEGTHEYLAPESILAVMKATEWPEPGPLLLPEDEKPYPWKVQAVQWFIKSGTRELANQYVYKSKTNDCWALGLVLLQLFTNKWQRVITAPYQGSTFLEKVILTSGPYTKDASIDEIITKVIKPLLRLDPSERMTSTDAYTILKGILQERGIEPFPSPEEAASAGDITTATKVGGAAYIPAAEAAQAPAQFPVDIVAGDAAARETVTGTIPRRARPH